MKKLAYLFVCGIFVLLLAPACDDFLEKTPGVDITEDTIFSSSKQFEYFMYGTYWWAVMSDLPYFDVRAKLDIGTGTATDESVNNTYTWYYPALMWNTANMNATYFRYTGDSRWFTYWIAIRRCNIILERIDDAQFKDISPAYAEELKKTSKGEAYMMRALQYFDLFKMYGGVPLLDHRLTQSDELLVPRATLQETYEFILKDCEEAIKLLPKPNEIPDNRRGRLSNVAAMFLKAKLMLFAASPLSNTDTPHLDFGANNNLIIFGYNRERWKWAADAAKEAIDEAERTGISLVRNKSIVENGETKQIPYRYMWETVDNEEVILADQPYEVRKIGHMPWNGICPNILGGASGQYMTVNFLKNYVKADGNPQTWETSGDDFLKKVKELEPRFQQTVSYHGCYWTQDYPSLDCTQDGRHNNETGLIIHKPLPYTISTTVGVIPKGIMFRLGDLYLMYAEALNEYYDTPPADAYKYVNLIRDRGGLGDLPANLTQDEFRKLLRRERAVELCNESSSSRLWDILRWMIAEEDGVMTGNMYGFKLTKNGSEVHYEVYPAATRTFKRRMYRLPFLQEEVNKGYLIQNPGF